ncbi:gamma-crystallin M3-like isoform X2 [Xyrichtys novacula]|uniref:Gamma-crystallin M3-like isoform X2 n=1 Tax=Xyrichtys novacula TaxID=13765 RepID=A0AAV1H0R4_XYRNO|nr:gamma-crystallin M3-like isoform X2 [Xyrichtys novacula]
MTMGKIIFYEDRNFQGRSYECMSDCSDMTSYLSRCHSCRVESGCFMVYDRPNFQGNQVLMRRGEYADYMSMMGMRDCIRSCRMIPMHRGQYRMRIYERENFNGQVHELMDDCDNIMDRFRMSDCMSCNVMDGQWLLFEQPHFRGRMMYLRPGEYRNFREMGMNGNSNVREVVQKLKEVNMRKVWEGVNTITGHNTKTRAVGGTVERANELKEFFNQFNQPMSPSPFTAASPSLSSTHLPSVIAVPFSSSSPSTMTQTFPSTAVKRAPQGTVLAPLLFTLYIADFYLFYVQNVVAIICGHHGVLGGSTSKKNTPKLEKLIRGAGLKLDYLVMVAGKGTIDKLLDIIDDASHPLHTVIINQKSLFSDRLFLPKCRTNRLKKSFVFHQTVQLLSGEEEG